MSKTKFTARPACGVLALILLAVSPALGSGILSVSPNSAMQGTSGLTVTFNLDSAFSPPIPPAGVIPTSVMLGTNLGSSMTHSSQYIVTAQFNIPALETVAAKDAAIAFSTPNGTLTLTLSAAFQVTPGSGLAAAFTAAPTSGTVPLTVTFTNSSTGTVTNQEWNFGDSATSTAANPAHTYTNTGSFTVSLTVFGDGGSNMLARAGYITVTAAASPGAYVIVDTGQTQCYNETTSITAPSVGQPFYGQDAQCMGTQSSYSLGGDGLTVYDNRTGLTWQRSPDTTGDGTINASDKLSYANALLRPAALNAANYGGYSDWRLPTIKELYSLVDFRGTDPSGLSSGADTSVLTPFINTNYFKFAYGDTNAGERIIDSQYASSTLYVSTAAGSSLFGVNFADGRIKGYGLVLNGSDKTFFVQCVRGNPSYGLNLFVDNGDQTITDQATGLMWAKTDSQLSMDWQTALAWVQARNQENYLGYHDWRLPNAKELQSIADYTRAPTVTHSAAIDPIFQTTRLSDGEYPFFWSSTTHLDGPPDREGSVAVYIAFGRGLGWMQFPPGQGEFRLLDVHGAGTQRSDPKRGNPGDYPHGRGPQGDVIRILNFVRLVRGG